MSAVVRMFFSCMNGECQSVLQKRMELIVNRLIEHFKKHDGVEFVTMEQLSDEFKKKNPVPPGALMPAPAGAMLQK